MNEQPFRQLIANWRHQADIDEHAGSDRQCGDDYNQGAACAYRAAADELEAALNGEPVEAEEYVLAPDDVLPDVIVRAQIVETVERPPLVIDE